MMLHGPKLGFLRFHQTIIFRRARDENCVPARFTGKQKQQRLAVLAHQLTWSCFWKNWYRESLNPSSLFFKEAPRGSSKQSPILWKSLILLRETSVSFGGSSISIHKAAETDKQQWLLLTKLLRNLALICNCIFHLWSSPVRKEGCREPIV